YKPSRRSALPVTTPLGDSPAPVGSEARPFPQGSSYTRSPQLWCGPVIEGKSSSSRLVSSPTSDRTDLGAFFQGFFRTCLQTGRTPAARSGYGGGETA